MGGSSPLARGLRAACLRGGVETGIIPARAGFTRARAPPPPRPWDHPRSRGVYDQGPQSSPPTPGSSPLARGLHYYYYYLLLQLRIIPARAGFTPVPGAPQASSADHPRSRGVYSKTHFKLPSGRGSSPLARGLPVAGGRLLRLHGIIPARAGFTRARTATSAWPSDHPRSRGVYVRVGAAGRAGLGSSPLARGLPFCEPGQNACVRIIPARAGFTHRKSTGSLAKTGSSPLARGLRALLLILRLRSGIIPARAGFTCDSSSGRIPMRDHPRSRGVYHRPS